MAHLPIRGRLDHIPVVFKAPNRQQSIVIGRLFLWRDAQPFVVGIEGLFTSSIESHSDPPRSRFPPTPSIRFSVSQLPKPRILPPVLTGNSRGNLTTSPS